MKKVLLLVIMAIAFSGCATTNNGGSDWDEWTSRLKKDTPSAAPAENQDWVKHDYGQ
jgi:hypothetical protein